MKTEFANRKLEEIAGMIEPCSRLADVGTDHAYLAISVIESKKADMVIASDVRKGPLAIAAQNIKDRGIPNGKIELRLGSGLTVLSENECGCIVIAGMGGLLIADILDRSPDVAKNAKQLILSPNTCEADLRLYLKNNGYKIKDEKGFKDGDHYYLIISCAADKNAKKGASGGLNGIENAVRPDTPEMFLGNIIPDRLNKDDIEYLKYYERKSLAILEGIDSSDAVLTTATQKKRALYTEIVTRIREVTHDRT